MSRKLRIIANVFKIGNIPIAPGTIASIFAAILSSIFITTFGILFFSCFIIFTFFIGWFAVYKDEKAKLDPSYIVIDEVLGQWVVFLFVTNITVINIFIAVLFFRFFDILKPWPICWIDKYKTNSKKLSSFLVIADDLIAGFLAGIFIFLIEKTFKL